MQIDFKDKKWRGLKVMLISFLVASAGALLAFLEFYKVGYWVAVVGIFSGFAGMAMHFVEFFSTHEKSGK